MKAQFKLNFDYFNKFQKVSSAIVVYLIVIVILFASSIRAFSYSDALIEKSLDKKVVKLAETEPTLDMAKLMKAIVYPEKARKEGISGRVTLKVSVSKVGKPTDIKVIESTDKIFEKPAINAMKKMKFKPGRNGKINCESEIIIPINFKLK